ncbi:esterase/lipase family protein [Hydrogenophaga sp. OTU3427]|uniref:esterase/lipase family protein n=1 Tax=Hydrogenophaga sp. OTU3427 TaxID=3043856 RepID=UPI00313B58B9
MSTTHHTHLRAVDLRAAAQLLTQATHGATRVVEGVHRAVLDTVGLPGGPTPGRTRGLTGLVYRGVHGVTALAGLGAEAVLARVEQRFPADTATPDSPQRLAMRSALNGVMGDRLATQGNSLALPMTLQHAGQPLDLSSPLTVPDASPRLLVMLHGLCMNDQQWTSDQGGQTVNHGEALAQALGCTPLYLRYNTGRHIADNGREFADQMEALLARWPVPVQEIALLGHSMGGLVARSAVHQAQARRLGWPARLRHLVCLGTPHHGAPLERAGQWLHILLGTTSYTAPLASLARLRSAGITDLRHGQVRRDDRAESDRFTHTEDRRQPLPLPAGVGCYAVAATTATRRSTVAERLLGDGLVPLRSALGEHDDPAHRLDFPTDHQWVAYRTGHLGLLGSPAVTAQLLRWLR